VNRNFPVSGLREIDAYLSALPKRMETAAVRQGLTAAAAVIRDEARLRAPKGSGRLAASIKSGSARKNQDGTFSISVRTASEKQGGNDHAFLGLFFEYGVRPHLIARKVPGQKRGRVGLRAAVGQGEKIGGVLRISGEGGDRFVSGLIEHPGFRAQPFMLPALDVRADDAVKAFAGKIREYLEGVKTKTGYDAAAGVASLREAA
jgi:HK97 gp10 family phage protein